MFELVLELVFQTNCLLPQESHNLCLVNKSCNATVKKFIGKKKFRRIQDLVDKDGLYLNSYENFLFIKSLGYVMYPLTITSIVKSRGDSKLLYYLVCKCKIQIPESAFIEAWKLQNEEIFKWLWSKCFDYHTKQNVIEWIDELIRYNKRKNPHLLQQTFQSAVLTV